MSFLIFQKVWNIFELPRFLLGFPSLSKQQQPLMRWDSSCLLHCWSTAGPVSKQVLPGIQMTQWVLYHTSDFFSSENFDFDGVSLCTLALAASVISSRTLRGFTWSTERTPGPTNVAGTSPKQHGKEKHSYYIFKNFQDIFERWPFFDYKRWSRLKFHRVIWTGCMVFSLLLAW